MTYLEIVFLFQCPILLPFLNAVFCSVGDNSPFYYRCVKNCKIQTCDSVYCFSRLQEAKRTKCESYKKKRQHSASNVLGFDFSLWSCLENCEYKCQWKTVEAFQRKNWPVPQFRGKWPFIRVFGFQEPASVVFSIINLYANVKLIKWFRKEVPNSIPFYHVWSIFAGVQINSWIWSIVYHTRDTDVTEKLDYMSAFLVVLYSLYGVGLRYFGAFFNIKFFVWSIFCALLAVNHLAYLWLFNFDYGYNMKLNCIIGGITLVLWILWSFLHFNTQPFVWKIFLFAILMSASMLLELMDFPPLFWVFDAHSLWHGVSVFVNIVFYMFLVDDCKYLYYVSKEKNFETLKKQ